MTAAILQAIDLHKRFGAEVALSGLELALRDGEVLALLGPTGAGKTTTLRCIAGLVQPDRGSIRLAGHDVTRSSARARDLALVFEGFNLLPTLSVFDNIAFPLKSPVYRESEDTVRARVNSAAEDLSIAHLLARRVTQLSGGERQRVAIARALVRDPTAYLLDEPLSALDLKLRETLQAELKRMHERNGATVLYASHDFPSAAALASRIALIDQGRILQVGTLAELIDDPRHAQVGRLIGSPAMSQFAGQVADGYFHCDETALRVPVGAAVRDGAALLGIWPEDIRLLDEGGQEATVYATDFRGRDRAVEAHFGPHRFRKAVPRELAVRHGDTIRFALPGERIFLFDAEVGARIDARRP